MTRAAASAHTGINGLAARVPAARERRMEPACPCKGAEHPILVPLFPTGCPKGPRNGTKALDWRGTHAGGRSCDENPSQGRAADALSLIRFGCAGPYNGMRKVSRMPLALPDA